jgi:hypothetical protein
MSLARGAYQLAKQRFPVIEEASEGAGAPIYMELRLFTSGSNRSATFFPSTIKAVLGVVAAQLPGALGDLAENHGQAAFTETLLSNQSIAGVP